MPVSLPVVLTMPPWCSPAMGLTPVIKAFIAAVVGGLGSLPGAVLGGFILGWVYLESGSIWVPVSLHLTMDMTNVVIFGIAGNLAVTKLSRPLNDTDRAIYRAGYVALIAVAVLGVYGLGLAPRWAG